MALVDLVAEDWPERIRWLHRAVWAAEAHAQQVGDGVDGDDFHRALDRADRLAVCLEWARSRVGAR
jgi:hypothetical protein